MALTMCRGSVTGFLGLSLLLSVVPACSASAGCRMPGAQADGSAPSGNIVYRPIYPGTVPPRKPFFLSGYAGATYPPVGQGGVLSPTGYWVRPDRPFPCFGYRWWGR